MLRTTAAEKVAVLGDLSGHVVPLLRELTKLGIEFDHPTQPSRVVTWPQDLAVIQVGDLVHKGPHSELAVALVHDLLVPTGRWIQLLGNHESQYLDRGIHFWDPKIDPKVVPALRQMWDTGEMVPAAAVVADDGATTVVTHAGVAPHVVDAVAHDLGRAPTGVEVVAALGDDTDGYLVFTPGMMAGRPHPPGVIWTEPRAELRLPWLSPHRPGLPLAFHQVHGHAQPLLYSGPRKPLRLPAELAATTHVEPGTGHVITEVATDGGIRRIVGIDPGATDKRAAAPRPLLLTGTVHW